MVSNGAMVLILMALKPSKKSPLFLACAPSPKLWQYFFFCYSDCDFFLLPKCSVAENQNFIMLVNHTTYLLYWLKLAMKEDPMMP